jgi:predicted transcriptional regulator
VPVDCDAWELRHLKHSERWTIYVPRAMREGLKRLAAARGQHPSLLVQEALRRYLTEEKPP